MEISAAIVTQNTVDAIMKDYNAKMVQLVEGIQNRDKALEGLNKQVEIRQGSGKRQAVVENCEQLSKLGIRTTRRFWKRKMSLIKPDAS